MNRPPIIHHLRERWPSLAAVGIAVQWFPAFSSLAPTHQNVHDCLYLSWLVHGQARHDIGDAQLVEGPGSLACVRPGIPHSIITATASTIEIVNIYLDPERHALPALPPDLRGPLHRLIPVHAGLGTRRDRLLAVTFSDPAPLSDVLARLWSEQQSERPGHLAMVEALGREFLILVARRLAEVGVRGPADANELLDRACAVLAERLADEVTLDDLAAAVGLSRSHLARRFHAYTGLAPMVYLMNLRLSEAALLLRSSDAPVIEIAVACGFKDLGHFSRCFKAMFASTPAAYRRPSSDLPATRR